MEIRGSSKFWARDERHLQMVNREGTCMFGYMRQNKVVLSICKACASGVRSICQHLCMNQIKMFKKLVTMLVKRIRINGKKNSREGKDCLEKNKLQYALQNKLYSYTHTKVKSNLPKGICQLSKQKTGSPNYTCYKWAKWVLSTNHAQRCPV